MSTEPARTALFRHLLATDLDLEKAFARLVAPDGNVDGSAVRVVVPPEYLQADTDALPRLLESILAEYEEIDQLLSGLREHDVPQRGETAKAVVTEDELDDPETLEATLEAMPSETARFEFLFDQAKTVLERLDVYELSRRPSATLVDSLRQQNNLQQIRFLVEFLRALHSAADSFEALDLPEPHIRDYLTHLYRMRNWREMERLVHHLEIAVGKILTARQPGAGAG